MSIYRHHAIDYATLSRCAGDPSPCEGMLRVTDPAYGMPACDIGPRVPEDLAGGSGAV